MSLCEKCPKENCKNRVEGRTMCFYYSTHYGAAKNGCCYFDRSCEGQTKETCGYWDGKCNCLQDGMKD